eukprot:ANDGO_03292.mRNA.1 Kinesin-like protein KIP3
MSGSQPREERIHVFLRCRPQNDMEKRWAAGSSQTSSTTSSSSSSNSLSVPKDSSASSTPRRNSDVASPAPAMSSPRPSANAQGNPSSASALRYPGDIIAGEDFAEGEASRGEVHCFDPYAKRTTTFTYNGFFDQKSTNEDIFKRINQTALIESVFDGFNSTVFVYGATGTGKTHTMMGRVSTAEPGLFHLLVDQIFQIRSSMQQSRPTVSVSFFEIYLEKVSDLISPDANSTNSPNATSDTYPVKEDSQGAFYVQNLSRVDIDAPEAFADIMKRGHRARVVRSTKDNLVSSRSHAVLQVSVENIAKNTRGTLVLVDLAGSERSSYEEEANLIRQSERAKINTSLLALGNAIDALSRGQYVQYRNSVLTKLLKNSLGGNARMVMIACVTPSSMTLSETTSTLYYASRAQNIKIRATRNALPAFPSSNSMQSLPAVDELVALIQGSFVEGQFVEAAVQYRDGRSVALAGATEWSIQDESGSIVDALAGVQNTWTIRLLSHHVGHRVSFCFRPSWVQLGKDGTAVPGVACLSELPVLASEPFIDHVRFAGRAIEGDVLCPVYDYFGGVEGDTLFEWQLVNSQNQKKFLSHSRAVHVKSAYLGLRLACKIVPMRVDGTRGTPQLVVSDAVKDSPPKIHGLRFIFVDGKLVMQGEYVGGKEGASRIQWQRSLLLRNFKPIDGATRREFYPSVDDFESYLRIAVLPVRSDNVQGEWQYSEALRLRIDAAFWAAVSQRISHFSASFNMILEPPAGEVRASVSPCTFVLGVSSWRLVSGEVTANGISGGTGRAIHEGNYGSHLSVVLDSASAVRMQIFDSQKSKPLLSVSAETSRMRDVVAITFRIFNILSLKDVAPKFVGKTGFEAWCEKRHDALKVMKDEAQSLIPQWLEENEGAFEAEEEKKLVNALFAVLVEHSHPK